MFVSDFLNGLSGTVLPQVLSIVITVSPVVLAFFLFFIAWDMWVRYVRQDFFSEINLKHTVLELTLPQETTKSPLAMETILTSLHNTSDTSWYSQYWKGEKRPWYSLELVSLGGQIKYMIWTEDRRKAGLMAALYAQFPGIEVQEREDYARSVHFDPKKMRIWAAEFKLAKNDVYPIKTYVDFGLDKDPKEEFKVDPLVNVLEFLGTVPSHSQIWIQIMITAHIDPKPAGFFSFKKKNQYKEDMIKEVDKIMVRNNKDTMKKLKAKPEDKIAGIANEDGFVTGPALSEDEKEQLKAIQRKASKFLFDCGVRILYICPKDKFDGPFGIGGSVSSMKAFGSENFNQLRPNGDTMHPTLGGLPWEDYRNSKRDMWGNIGLFAYKRRSFFYPPYQGLPVVLNTEELATMYHFPGSVAATPALNRIPSKKATAPSNLPI